MSNIFRQAYELVKAKKSGEMTPKEVDLFGRAILALNEMPKVVKEADSMSLSQALLRVAEWLEELEQE